MQVTASKIELLLNCSRPFNPTLNVPKEEVGEPARYGSAYHECEETGVASHMAVKKVAKKWGVEAHTDELCAHLMRTRNFLAKWLAGENGFGETFTIDSRETHRAGPVAADGGDYATPRECAFDDETHTYELEEGEFGGTDDLVASNDSRTIVIDYKTGDYGPLFHTPSKMPQMLALAILTGADTVGILHTPRNGVPTMFVDDVSPSELTQFEHDLQKAYSRIGDGSLRPGPWCNRCPALDGCPAQDGALLKKAGALIASSIRSEELLAPVDKGHFHMFLSELERLAKRAREVLREEVRAGAVIIRPDGKVLTIQKKEIENLSKASIVRALGKTKGEKLIEDLRKKGCVETREQDELRAVNE